MLKHQVGRLEQGTRGDLSIGAASGTIHPRAAGPFSAVSCGDGRGDLPPRSRIRGRIQPFVATPCVSLTFSNWSRVSAGVFEPRVFLGLVLSASATASSSSALCTLRSVPFGKYWRSNPFVFSLVPRCHGL